MSTRHRRHTRQRHPSYHSPSRNLSSDHPITKHLRTNAPPSWQQTNTTTARPLSSTRPSPTRPRPRASRTTSRTANSTCHRPRPRANSTCRSRRSNFNPYGPCFCLASNAMTRLGACVRDAAAAAGPAACREIGGQLGILWRTVSRGRVRRWAGTLAADTDPQARRVLCVLCVGRVPRVYILV